jgi:peptide/nickel transport system substrate-binding protein
MRKKVWFSASAGALGIVLLLAAALAGPAAGKGSGAAGTTHGAKKGGTLNIAQSASDFDYTDPALAYGVTSWQVLYETCVKLLNTPDKAGQEGIRLVPEAAAGLPIISKDGKTYTFTVPPGKFKFNTGEAVTAQSFKHAIDRDANPAMNSPVVPFITNIVGLNAVVAKKAKTVSGVTVKGNKLTIRLTESDGGLLNKIALNFFCAIPKNMPINPDGLAAYPGAGPYYIASREVNRQTILKRNPNYKGNRPANADTIVITVNTNPQQTYLQVESGQYDYDMTGVVPTVAAGLAQKYGINKGRFFVNKMLETDYVPMNASRVFKDVSLRKAVNYAMDRPALLRVRGFQGGSRSSQILPPGLAGKHAHVKLYPLKGADVAKAKQLAGNKCGKVNLWYAAGPTGTPQSGILRYNLEQMGCDVTTKPFQGFAIYTAAGVKGNDMDLMFAGWVADYPDPYDFFHILLDGTAIHETNNNNLAYLNDPTLNKQIAAANRLSGEARINAYGALDVSAMTRLAPWAPIDNRNERDFLSARVGGYIFSLATGAMDLGAAFIK